MKKYEYYVTTMFQGDRTEGLNKLGSDRWELIAVCDNSFYFKREVK